MHSDWSQWLHANQTETKVEGDPRNDQVGLAAAWCDPVVTVKVVAPDWIVLVDRKFELNVNTDGPEAAAVPRNEQQPCLAQLPSLKVT